MNLDLSGVSASTGKTVLPTGIYNMKVVGSEIKETKTKGGYMLIVSQEVKDGEHAGKVIVDRLNVVNANPQAEEIGKGVLKTILTVGGYANPDLFADSNDLLGMEFSVSVECSDSKWTNDKGEEVDGKEQKFLGYFKLQAAKAVPVAQAAPQTQAAAPAPIVEAPPAVNPPAPVATPTPAASGGFPWAK